MVLGILAYWYFLPYQFFLALLNSSIAGAVVANTILF
ncbi:hypothetical protein ES708_22895 [subsurface metagenome]